MATFGATLVLGCLFYFVQADAPFGHGGGIQTGYLPALKNNFHQVFNPQPLHLFNGHKIAMSYFPDPALDGSGPYPAANRQYYKNYIQSNGVHQARKPIYHTPKQYYGGPKGVKGRSQPIYVTSDGRKPLKMIFRLVNPSYKKKPAPIPDEDASPFDEQKISKDIVAGLTQSARGLLGVLVNGLSTATGLVKGASTTFVSGVSTGSELLQSALTTFREHLTPGGGTPEPQSPKSPSPYYY